MKDVFDAAIEEIKNKVITLEESALTNKKITNYNI